VHIEVLGRRVLQSCYRPLLTKDPPFSEAAALFLRMNPEGKSHLRKLAGKHGKSKAMSILAAKLGRTVYFMLEKDRAFDMERFMARSH